MNKVISELAKQPVQEIETEKSLTGKTIVKDPEQIKVQTKQLKASHRKLEEKEIEIGNKLTH